MEISGTAAIVTGGASGLGAATAAALAARGSEVFAVDLPASIERVVSDAAPPVGVRLVAADVTDAEQVDAAVRQAASAGPPLRIVVNCAGVGWAGRVLSRNGPHDLELFRTVVEINLVGTFNVLRLAAQAIADTEPLADDARGVIVNTASIAAFEGQVGQIAYAASKGGVVAMTLSAARDLSQFGIRVNSIAPGIVDTPMLAALPDETRTGLAASVPFPKRLGRPSDFAQLAMLLVEHDYLNGEVIRMDGALRMPPR